MAKTTTTTKKKEGNGASEKSLEQLILEKSHGKYSVVDLASMWALVLRRREEHRHLGQPEVLDLALRDILSGDVSEEEVQSHAAEAAASLAAAEHALSGGLPKEKEKK